MTKAADGASGIRVQAAQIGLFETPVLHARLAGHEPMTAALLEAIRQHRDSVAGIGRSNVGGWHSATDMLDWGGAAAAELNDWALKLVRRVSRFEGRDAADMRWTTRMWANVSPPGALNTSHAHPGVLWAAVYYCDMGSPPAQERGGELYFEDPRFPVPLMRMPGFRMVGIDGEPQQNERRMPTEAGDLVLFPAWLRHGVRPHHGTRDRVSIAMNIDAAG